MELKNIFKMTKTDRYTQDGRDELAKLQETEDVTYKTGDISQKTGLQKQPDGSWAPPKKGGAAPKMGSPEYNEKYGLTKRDVATGKEVDRIYEKQQNRIKELKAKGYTDEQIENDKIYQQTKEDMRNVGKPKSNVPGNIPLNNEYYKDDVRTEAGARKILSETKTEAIQSRIKELETLKEKNGGKLGPQGEKDLQMNKEELEKRSGNAEGKWQNSEALDFVHKLPPLNEAKTEQLFEAQDKLDEEWIAKKGNVDKERFEQAKALIKGELNKRGTTGKDYWAWKKTAGDSAPRELTGDTKIRIKK